MFACHQIACPRRIFSAMMFTKTTVSAFLLSSVFAAVSAQNDNCPFSSGTYRPNSYLNKEGRVAVGGCFVDNNIFYEFNSDGTESNRQCQPANCNGVPATVVNNGSSCDVTIENCFSNQPGGGEPTSLTFTFGGFDVNVSSLVACCLLCPFCLRTLMEISICGMAILCFIFYFQNNQFVADFEVPPSTGLEIEGSANQSKITQTNILFVSYKNFLYLI